MSRSRKQKGGANTGLSSVLPTTSWGNWSSYPGALAWSATSQAPPPLANGGLYTAPQSTGAWASQPFPATLYAWSAEASRVAGNPEVFYHQRPNDNNGASFSPYVGVPMGPNFYEARIPPDVTASAVGGGRKNHKNRKSRKNRKGKGKDRKDRKSSRKNRSIH